MTPPLFLAGHEALLGDEVVVDGEQGRHGVTVRRLLVGERVLIGDGLGLVGRGIVAAVSGKDTFVVAIEERVQVPVPAPRVTVVQALIKGDRLDRAVETLTEAGVDAIAPWAAQRCVVRWDRAQADKSLLRLERKSIESAKQSRRPHVVKFEPLMRTTELVESASSATIVLHQAARPLTDVDLSGCAELTLVVGPEGGISEDELAALESGGAQIVQAGPTVMRASTAGTVALAYVLAAVGRWAGATAGRRDRGPVGGHVGRD